MAADTEDGSHGWHTLGRHAPPLRDGGDADAQRGGELGHQPGPGDAEAAGQTDDRGGPTHNQDTLNSTQCACQRPFMSMPLDAVQLNCKGAAMDLGEVIRRARKARGWRQSDLARKLGVTHGLVSQWETNIGTPTNAMRAEIALALKIRLIDLMPELSRAGLPELDDEMIAVMQRLAALRPEMRSAVIGAILGLDANGPRADAPAPIPAAEPDIRPKPRRAPKVVSG